MTEYDIFIAPDGQRAFACDCGAMLVVADATECDSCGAHYAATIEQTAPPIGST